MSRVSHRMSHCWTSPSEKNGGGVYGEQTCQLERLALEQMLFSPLPLLLGLLDPLLQTQNITAGVQRLLTDKNRVCSIDPNTRALKFIKQHTPSKKSAKTKVGGLPVDAFCVRRERRASEARWCCRWQRRRGRRLAGSRWEIWRAGRCPSSYHTQTQNCRGSGSGPG